MLFRVSLLFPHCPKVVAVRWNHKPRAPECLWPWLFSLQGFPSVDLCTKMVSSSLAVVVGGKESDLGLPLSHKPGFALPLRKALKLLSLRPHCPPQPLAQGCAWEKERGTVVEAK